MHVHRLGRLSAATLMIASLGALTGCELNPFSDTASEQPTVNLVRAGRMLGQADVKRLVPTGASAPAGYAAERTNLLRPERSGRSTTTPARCETLTAGIDVDFIKAPTKGYRTFVNSEKSFLGVGLSSRAGSLAGLAGPKSALAGCQRFVVKTKTETIRYTVKALPFPKLGEESLAVRATGRSGKLPITFDAVRIQMGHNTVLVDAVTTGKKLPVTAELEEAANTVLMALSR